MPNLKICISVSCEIVNAQAFSKLAIVNDKIHLTAVKF